MSKADAHFPMFGVWNWMTSEEQAKHMVHEHGYDESWIDDDGVTTKQQAEDYWVRHGAGDLHEEDHDEYPYGGGEEHTHREVDEREVRAAVESIAQTVRSRQ